MRIFVYVSMVVAIVLIVFRTGFVWPRLQCQNINFREDNNNCDVYIKTDENLKYILRVVVIKKSFSIRNGVIFVYQFNDEKRPWAHWGVLYLKSDGEKNLRLVKSRDKSVNMDYRVITYKEMVDVNELNDVLNDGYFGCNECKFEKEVFVGVIKKMVLGGL